jgi:hypothetical protein
MPWRQKRNRRSSLDVVISRPTADALLDLHTTVAQLRVRHPEVFAGQLWKELAVALYKFEREVMADV